MAPEWFVEHLGWKKATAKATKRCERFFGVALGPNLADLSGSSSTAIAGEVYRVLGIPVTTLSGDIDSEDETSESAGTRLERALEKDIRTGLATADPSRGWEVIRSGSVAQFSQYTHLAELQVLFEERPSLRTVIGRDYEVSTDVMVSVPDPTDASRPRVLHAAVSSKLTIRSDRVQNIRYEFATLVRNRKGRLPHLVAVTAEPLPSRLVSIARGTGELDAVYHLLFDEMNQVAAGARPEGAQARSWDDQWANWREMVDQGRVKPYSELVPLLAVG